MECMLFADDWVWGDRGKEDDYEVTGLVVVSKLRWWALGRISNWESRVQYGFLEIEVPLNTELKKVNWL